MSDSIEIDGHSYSVHATGNYGSAAEGQPLTVEFRVTGGLVPRGRIEYVRVGMEDGVGFFVMGRDDRCIPYATQENDTLAAIAARHVHRRPSEGQRG